MSELRNGWPSTVPLTFTRPRVPKYSAEFGTTTKVHPPLFGLFCRVALNCLLELLIEDPPDQLLLSRRRRRGRLIATLVRESVARG
jgi:hypothetical protein